VGFFYKKGLTLKVIDDTIINVRNTNKGEMKMVWFNVTGYDIKVEMVNGDFGHEDFWQTETLILKKQESVDERYGFALNRDFVLVLHKGEVIDKETECREQNSEFGYIVLI
jgi:hypothetical protein